MYRAIVLFALLLLPATSFAQRTALTPQNRVHAGVGLTEMTAFGLTGGLDSRLTRIIYVDAAGFVSASSVPDVEVTDDADPGDLIFLRHGLYVAPGLRVPHRYGEGVNWDFAVRAGFASVWNNDVSQGTDTLQADPALLGGADLLVRYESLGLRASGKGFFFKPFSSIEREELTVIRPHGAMEVFYQW